VPAPHEHDYGQKENCYPGSPEPANSIRRKVEHAGNVTNNLQRFGLMKRLSGRSPGMRGDPGPEGNRPVFRPLTDAAGALRAVDPSNWCEITRRPAGAALARGELPARKATRPLTDAADALRAVDPSNWCEITSRRPPCRRPPLRKRNGRLTLVASGTISRGTAKVRRDRERGYAEAVWRLPTERTRSAISPNVTAPMSLIGRVSFSSEPHIELF
jgi:hypothetical protein